MNRDQHGSIGGLLSCVLTSAVTLMLGACDPPTATVIHRVARDASPGVAHVSGSASSDSSVGSSDSSVDSSGVPAGERLVTDAGLLGIPCSELDPGPITSAADAGGLGSGWENTGHGTVVPEGDQLRLRLPEDEATFARITSVATVDLSRCAVALRLTELPDPELDVAVYLHAHDVADAMSIRISQGGIGFYAREDGETIANVDRDYSSSEHVWVRIREADGWVRYETSADARVWWEQLAHARPGFIDAVHFDVTFTAFTPLPRPASVVVSRFSYLR